MNANISFAEKFLQHSAFYQNQFHDYEYPKISIIIPTYNCAQAISITLDSLLSQNYPEFEILIIDGGSQDRTLEVIKRYRGDRFFFHFEQGTERYSLLNKGISLAQGEYLNFLFPGDFYVSKDTLKQIMAQVLSHNKPELAYCGTLLRDGRTEVKILYRPLNLNLLKRGLATHKFIVCLVLKAIVFSKNRGYFNNSDLGCVVDSIFVVRFMFFPTFYMRSTPKSFYRLLHALGFKSMIIRHFTETGNIIYTHFGLVFSAWRRIQKDITRYLKLWVHSAKWP